MSIEQFSALMTESERRRRLHSVRLNPNRPSRLPGPTPARVECRHGPRNDYYRDHRQYCVCGVLCLLCDPCPPLAEETSMTHRKKPNVATVVQHKEREMPRRQNAWEHFDI